MDIKDLFLQKIDQYIQQYVLPHYNPNDIYWWFSLSGGKDSFCMCQGVYTWYRQHGFHFQGSGFTVKQWNNTVFESLQKQIDWLDIRCIDALDETQRALNYQMGEQAPCSQCSAIRKQSGDAALFPLMDRTKVNFVARGLHFGDTAISYLWRWVFCDHFPPAVTEAKYLPITPIADNVFLVKPLCFVREIETHLYSRAHQYVPVCCMCPACRFPSRRDIVEESLLHIYLHDQIDFWEYSVPGMADYIRRTAPCDYTRLTDISAKGFMEKCNHLPESFFSFALDYFRDTIKAVDIDMEQFNGDVYLDDIGKRSLITGVKETVPGKLPLPSFFLPDAVLSDYERRMIATLGPFWGAMGLTPHQQQSAFDIQTALFHFTPDTMWGQVNSLLNIYYRRMAP